MKDEANPKMDFATGANPRLPPKREDGRNKEASRNCDKCKSGAGHKVILERAFR
jgi:hypothetical protein